MSKNLVTSIIKAQVHLAHIFTFYKLYFSSLIHYMLVGANGQKTCFNAHFTAHLVSLCTDDAIAPLTGQI